jgi:hypothetical protein
MFKKSIRNRWWAVLLSIIIAGLLGGGYMFYSRGRPAPLPVERKIFENVTYDRVVRLFPRPMIAHVLVVDTKTKRLQFLVTPPEENWRQLGYPIKARTTSRFLDEFNLQIAINGDGFYPWWSRGPFDYYPHNGDVVTPLGIAASSGQVYSTGDHAADTDIGPTLYISRRNSLTFNNPPNKIFQAISGERMLVMGGRPVVGLDNSELDPRTAIGINRNGRWLYIVVVDGRQPFYSEGATFVELAELLIDFGAYHAMAMDGGGSSTMVIEDKNGDPVVLNSPIDQYIPGRERPVANHLGIYLKE